MIAISRLIWDGWNIHHIARHSVSQIDVEEVCRGDYLTRQTYQGRIMVIGTNAVGNLLSVILAPEDAGQYYVVTARPTGGQKRATDLPADKRRCQPMTDKKMTGKKKTEKAKTRSRTPEFANYEEEAEFWDTHDVGDYWDETDPVDIKFSQNLSENLTVRLSPEVLSIMRRQADQMGIGPSTLARMWIVKHVRESMRNKSRQAS